MMKDLGGRWPILQKINLGLDVLDDAIETMANREMKGGEADEVPDS